LYGTVTIVYNNSKYGTKTSVKKTEVVFYWDQPFLVGWVGWVLLCSIGEKPFLVGLVDQPFQPASNRVEMVEKALA